MTASQPIHSRFSRRLQVPLLESDCLIALFERRYNAMPHYAKELIEGTVYMASPCVLNPMPNHTAISWLAMELQNCHDGVR